MANLPKDGIAFWSEKYKVSDNIVSRIGFVLNVNKHWNLSADGTGAVMKPGIDTLISSDEWISVLENESLIDDKMFNILHIMISFEKDGSTKPFSILQ